MLKQELKEVMQRVSRQVMMKRCGRNGKSLLPCGVVQTYDSSSREKHLHFSHLLTKISSFFNHLFIA